MPRACYELRVTRTVDLPASFKLLVVMNLGMMVMGKPIARFQIFLGLPEKVNKSIGYMSTRDTV